MDFVGEFLNSFRKLPMIPFFRTRRSKVEIAAAGNVRIADNPGRSDILVVGEEHLLDVTLSEENFLGVTLSIAPLLLTFLAWRRQGQADNPGEWRLTLFRAGLFASLLCAAITVCSWADPNIRSFELGAAANLAALVTLVLACFGRRSSRALLCGAAVIQLVMAYGALLSIGG